MRTSSEPSKSDPSLAEAHWQRATLKTFQPGDPDLATLEALAAGHRLPPAQMVCVHFALGKALDDVGQYDPLPTVDPRPRAEGREAGDQLSSSPELFGPIIDTFDAELFQPGRRRRILPAPIFILGMPRPAVRWSNRFWPAIRWCTAAASC